MPKYIAGTVTKYGDELLLEKVSESGIVYNIWKEAIESSDSFMLCEKIHWGSTRVEYYEICRSNDSGLLKLILDDILSWKIVDTYEFVRCRICGKFARHLAVAHLQRIHNLSVEEYLERFCYKVPVWSLAYSDSMKNLRYTKGNNWLGRKHTEETKAKMRESDVAAALKRWSNPIYKDKQVRAIAKGNAWHPNKPEIFLNNFLQSRFPGEWKYTGDGSFSIEGQIPDFINIDGRKLAIEFNGCRWHCCEKCGFGNVNLPNGMTPEDVMIDDTKKIEIFAKYGIGTIIIWEHELKLGESFVMDKINRELS